VLFGPHNRLPFLQMFQTLLLASQAWACLESATLYALHGIASSWLVMVGLTVVLGQKFCPFQFHPAGGSLSVVNAVISVTWLPDFLGVLHFMHLSTWCDDGVGFFDSLDWSSVVVPRHAFCLWLLTALRACATSLA